jgi:hypothetical protein
MKHAKPKNEKSLFSRDRLKKAFVIANVVL